MEQLQGILSAIQDQSNANLAKLMELQNNRMEKLMTDIIMPGKSTGVVDTRGIGRSG